MSFNAMMKKALVAAAGLLAVLFFAVGPAAADWMSDCSDEFNDESIDTTKWLAEVSNANEIAINETAGGYLEFDRHTGSNHYAEAGVFGRNAAEFGDLLIAEFDILHAGNGSSNYARIALSTAQIDINNHKKPDSIVFQTSHGGGKGWFRQYYNGGLLAGTVSVDVCDGTFRIVLDRTSPTEACASIEWYDPDTSLFVTKGGFDVDSNLVKDQYYINMSQEAYMQASIQFDYVHAMIPEPSTAAMLVMAGLAGLAWVCRRRL